MPNNLKFGLWYSLRNPRPWQRPYHDIYEGTLQQIAWAEGLGYDDVWLTEHHFCEDGHAPSILPLAAAVAARTKKIRVGTSVLLLPLHHAVRVAEDAAAIDILSNGRFELGVGIGYRPQEFAGLGLRPQSRASRMDESLEIIDALWRGESVNYSGKHYQLQGAQLTPMPVQNPIPLWVGGFAPASAARAAKYGGYIGAGDMSSQVKLYHEERARLGKPGRGHIAGGHFWLVASNDPIRTLAQVGPHVMYQIQMYNQWLGEAGQTLFPVIERVEQLVELGILLVVTPAEAIDRIATYAEATGIERYYSWTVPPGMPEAQMNEYLQLFAEEVIPKFKR